MADDPIAPRRIHRSSLLAAGLFTGVCLAGIFVLGWWQENRTDPLFALPVMGLAALAAIAAGGHGWRFAAGGALLCAVLTLLTAIIGAGFDEAPHAAAQAIGAGGFAFAALALGSLILTQFGKWRSGWSGKAIKIGCVIVLLGGWHIAAQSVLAHLYNAAPGEATDANLPHVRIISSLALRRIAAPDALAGLLVADDGGGAPRGPAPEQPALWQDAPIIDVLERNNVVEVVDAIGALPTSPHFVLILAHPPALPAADLARLDAWIRGGGRAIIMADALLSSPMPHLPGDPRNPPVTSLLTPLLDHWGLRLDAPANLAVREAVVQEGGARFTLLSPGRFVRLRGPCAVRSDGRLARCALGRGQVELIADVDFIDPRMLASGQDDPRWRFGTMRWLQQTIDRLTGHPIRFGRARPLWLRFDS